MGPEILHFHKFLSDAHTAVSCTTLCVLMGSNISDVKYIYCTNIPTAF